MPAAGGPYDELPPSGGAYPSGEYPGMGEVEPLDPPGGPLIGAELGIADDEGEVLEGEAPGAADAPGGGGGAPVEVLVLATVDEPPPSPPQPAR